MAPRGPPRGAPPGPFLLFVLEINPGPNSGGPPGPPPGGPPRGPPPGRLQQGRNVRRGGGPPGAAPGGPPRGGPPRASFGTPSPNWGRSPERRRGDCLLLKIEKTEEKHKGETSCDRPQKTGKKTHQGQKVVPFRAPLVGGSRRAVLSVGRAATRGPPGADPPGRGPRPPPEAPWPPQRPPRGPPLGPPRTPPWTRFSCY
jgi:hypothetical protein